jgi:O-antigen ligase
VAQVLTFSIGGWTATGLGLVVVLVGAGRRRLLLGLALLGLVGILLLAAWRPERITSHLTGAGDSTSLLRVRLWGSALEMLWDHPLFGVGLDNFVYQLNPARGGSYLDPAAWREPDLSHPHNLALDWWLSLGVGGLLLLVRLLERFRRLARAALAGSGGAIALGALGAMVAALAHGLTDNSFFLPDLAALWWATFVLVGAQQTDDGGLGGA